jgi:hypothetical protein
MADSCLFGEGPEPTQSCYPRQGKQTFIRSDQAAPLLNKFFVPYAISTDHRTRIAANFCAMRHAGLNLTGSTLAYRAFAGEVGMAITQQTVERPSTRC